MLNKKIKQKTDLGVTVIIIIGILAVVNFLSYQIFHRWDLTQNKDYSISAASKQTVSKLDDIVNIKVYFSKNLPSQYVGLPQEVGDILDEYAVYSKGKIRVEFIDPGEDKDLEQKLYMQGIPQLQFNVLEKDKYQVVKGYLGIVVEYGDKTQPIPVVENTDNLEYQVTLAIKKAVSKETDTVGIWTNNSTIDMEKEMSAAYKKLQEQYQVYKVDLASAKEIPQNVKILIIAGPKEKFNDNQLKAIDAFLMRGGKIFVMAGGVKISEGLVAEKNDVGLNKLLESYGVKLNNDLVLDASNGVASFNQGFMTFSVNYPFWPKIMKSGFDKDNGAVAKLENLIFPWASSIDVLSDKIDKSDKVSYLAHSSEKSWSQNDNFNLNPQQEFAPSGKTGSRNLAVSIFGKFSSAYKNGETDSGRLIVVGDSDFAKDGFIQNSPSNLVFFQNMVDSLSLDEDLINIRSKGVYERPIGEISETVKATVRYLNVFGITVLVMIFGMARYYIRRRNKFADEL